MKNGFTKTKTRQNLLILITNFWEHFWGNLLNGALRFQKKGFQRLKRPFLKFYQKKTD